MNPLSLKPRKPPSSKGELKVWLTATGLNVGLFMIIGLLGLIAWNGLSVFWPQPVTELTLSATPDAAESRVAGIITKRQARRSPSTGEAIEELQLFVGNRDAYGLAFRFLDVSSISATHSPLDILVAERSEYGKAIFYPVRLEFPDGRQLSAQDPLFLTELERLVAAGNQRRKTLRSLEKNQIGATNATISKLEPRLQRPDLTPAQKNQIESDLTAAKAEYATLAAKATELRNQQKIEKLVYRLSSGEEKTQDVAEIIQFYAPNRLSFWQRFQWFLSHALAFLSEEPREANTEGGIFPAIFGTFVMTLLMAALVTPLGIVAAIYLHEYAKPGLFLRAIRISVNNLAGVPSIVFGVFGLGFFVYGMGGFIDRGPTAPLPERWWFIVALGAITTLTLPFSFLWPINPQPACCPGRRRSRMLLREQPMDLRRPAHSDPGQMPLLRGLLPAITALTHLRHRRHPLGLPHPRAHDPACRHRRHRGGPRRRPPRRPRSRPRLRRLQMADDPAHRPPRSPPRRHDGRHPCHGPRRRRSRPPHDHRRGQTGAPSLPIDGTAPFIHAERKFMHLGFHIYDLGFQSPDSEAAKPMVFATTLLLIASSSSSISPPSRSAPTSAANTKPALFKPCPPCPRICKAKPILTSRSITSISGTAAIKCCTISISPSPKATSPLSSAPPAAAKPPCSATSTV
jgi:ABC-type phosphate transport system permease subunit